MPPSVRRSGSATSAFPGVAYENGGGAFLIPYLVALITAGIPILFLDYAIGHRFRGSAPAAFRRLGGQKAGRWLEGLGWFQVAIAFVIGLYYTVVIAWALSYFVFSFDLRWGDDPAAFLTGDYLQVGIPGFSFEFVPSVLIPLVIVWVATNRRAGRGRRQGRAAGQRHLPSPSRGRVRGARRAGPVPGRGSRRAGTRCSPRTGWLSATRNVWVAAYSQIFFSLSIAFGIMITDASYRKRKANLTAPGLVVAFANSSFEILAGIGVFATLGFFAFEQGVEG